MINFGFARSNQTFRVSERERVSETETRKTRGESRRGREIEREIEERERCSHKEKYDKH